jgi:hypothetical protein
MTARYSIALVFALLLMGCQGQRAGRPPHQAAKLTDAELQWVATLHPLPVYYTQYVGPAPSPLPSPCKPYAGQTGLSIQIIGSAPQTMVAADPPGWWPAIPPL